MAFTAFSRRSFYNPDMILLRAPSGASEALAHAVELTNRDLGGWLDKLDTGEQERFWRLMEAFAAGKRNSPERNVPLSFDEAAPQLVREALSGLDMKMAEHVGPLSRSDREQFWTMVRGFSEQQAGHSRQPQPRL